MLPGLVDFGLRIKTFLFLDHDLTQSGINLSSDQSPHNDIACSAILLWCFYFKKDLGYVWIISSAEALFNYMDQSLRGILFMIASFNLKIFIALSL